MGKTLEILLGLGFDMTDQTATIGFQNWRIDGAGQTIVFAAKGSVIPGVIYWGSKLDDADDLIALAELQELDVTGGMLDANPELSMMPLVSRTFPGQAGMHLRRFNGEPFHPNFELGVTTTSASGIEFVCHDTANKLRLFLAVSLDPSLGTLQAQTRLESEVDVYCDWLAAPVFPGSQSSDEMIDFSGKWIGEFATNRTPWGPGARLRDNPTGRTGHEHFPGLIVPDRGCTNTQGQAYAFHYGWSGGHRMVAEELSDGRRQVQFGHATGARTTAAKKFASATLYGSFSDQGLNGCAVAMQRLVREQIVKLPNPKKPRPVHYNCWEAVYFDHDLDQLKVIADKAADIGAERFVLDDGWFKNRKDDFRALGDWVIDEQKYPNGLTPLIDHVKSKGMTFGIWFEPEMVNLDSDVYRAHPDWLLGDVDQIPGRQQYVLDMANSAVRKYLFDSISKVLSDYDIDYIKWDHNRVLPIANSTQTLGTYGLLDSLRQAHPGVEIESCSSGGGRIDYGILSRTHRVWLSDSNDAVERMRIQHDAALFLPSSVVGSHVGPRICHTSGRQMDIRTRAWTAAQRHMGFEMDPNELSDEEFKILKTVTAWWKTNRTWMMSADVLRLDSDDPAVLAEQQLAVDKSQFVVFVGSQKASTQVVPRPLKLTGLDPKATYRIDLVNRVDAHHLSRGSQALKTRPVEMSGQALMHVGAALPWSFPQSVWVVKGVKVSATATAKPNGSGGNDASVAPVTTKVVQETTKTDHPAVSQAKPVAIAQPTATVKPAAAPAQTAKATPAAATVPAAQVIPAGTPIQASFAPTLGGPQTIDVSSSPTAVKAKPKASPKISIQASSASDASPNVQAAFDRIISATNQKNASTNGKITAKADGLPNGTDAANPTAPKDAVKPEPAKPIATAMPAAKTTKAVELTNAAKAKAITTAPAKAKLKKAARLSELGSEQPSVSSISSWTQVPW